MPTMAEVRAKYPQYNDMPDEALASALHAKFYSDMPEEEFAAKIGLAPSQPTPSARDRREGTPPSLDAVPNVKPRWGDATLKPIFGSNPATDIYDTFIDPFVPTAPKSPEEKAHQDWLAQRSAGERAKDTGAFALSLPVRLVTRGQYGAGDVATALGRPDTGEGLAASEQNFGRANAPQLEAVQAAGDVALGTMGVTGAGRVPVTRERVPGTPAIPPRPQAPSMPSSGPARARAYVNDLDELGISRHGPAVAQASRDAEGLGTVAKVIEGMPIVSGPLRRSTKEFVESTARAGDTIAQKYSPGGGNIDKAGGALRSYADDFKNERTIPKDDIAALPDAEIVRLASTPPRDIGSLKTATDARYEAAWRQIPEDMRKGASFIDDPRLMGHMPASRAVLEDVAGRNQRMTLQSGANAAPKGATAPIASGGLLGEMAKAIMNNKWGANLQTMRNMRSTIRRMASKTTDTEANTLSRADLQRMQGAISQDMTALMQRIAERFRNDGDIPRAEGFERALQGFRRADQFTRRYAEAFKDLKPLVDVKRNPEAIGKIIAAAAAGAKGNTKLLLQLRRVASPEVLDDTAAAVINEMGRPTGQAGSIVQEAGWSIPKFASQWDAMSPAGRKLIFGHRPELYRQLDKFANVARGMKDYEALANTSKSGTHSIVGTLLIAGPAAVLGNLQAVVLTAATSYGIAHWLTSPAYIAWLTRSTALQRAIAQGEIPAARAAAETGRLARMLKEMVNKDRTLSTEVAAEVVSAIDLATKGNGNDRPAQ